MANSNNVPQPGFREATALFLDACPGPPLARTGLRIAAFQEVHGIRGLTSPEDSGRPLHRSAGIRHRRERRATDSPRYLRSVEAVGKEDSMQSRLPLQSGPAPRLFVLARATLDPFLPRNRSVGSGIWGGRRGLEARLQRCGGLESVHCEAGGQESKTAATASTEAVGAKGRRRRLFGVPATGSLLAERRWGGEDK